MGVPKLKKLRTGGNTMKNQALWKMMATLLVMVADLMIEKIVKSRRKEQDK